MLYPSSEDEFYFRPRDPKSRGTYLLSQDLFDIHIWSARGVTQTKGNAARKDRADENSFIAQMVRILEQDDLLAFDVWF